MAFSNNMTKLLKKAERRLGLRILESRLDAIGLGRSSWTEAVIEDSIPTFSRFFPREIDYSIDPHHPKDEEGFWLIDEAFVENKTIIGVRDLDFKSFNDNTVTHLQEIGYGSVAYDDYTGGLEDIGYLQMNADIQSLFNSGIYPIFVAPNKIALKSATGDNIINSWKTFRLKILIEHDPNLLTISPTLMEIFEELALSDIANFLLQNLKYYDGLETIYTNMELKLEQLEKWADHREEVVSTLDDAHVSASNPSCPVMLVCK